MNRLLVLALLASLGCAHSERATALARARDSWAALKDRFDRVPGHPGFFSDELTGTSTTVKPAAVWSEGQAVHAALNLAKLTGDYDDFNRVAPTLSRYLLTRDGTTGFAPCADPETCDSPKPPPARWWDDNGITATTLMQAHHQVPGRGYLAIVKNVWPFLLAGQWPQGGQHENETVGGDSFATVATAENDETAELLYLATGAADPHHAEYLDFARKNDAAIKSRLRSPDGLYWNGYRSDPEHATYKWCDGTKIPPDGCSGTWWFCNPTPADLPVPPPSQRSTSPEICSRVYQQNLGLMIKSDVLLFQITGDTRYLASAKQTARAALDLYTPDWLWRQSPWLNAELFIGLISLNHYAPNPRYRAALAAYLNRAWTEGRDPATGLFTRGGIGVYNPKVGIHLLDQSGMVILYTVLAWPEEDVPNLF
jgi:hypothetical protein